jgi:potassium-transporting ATPase KdpC subunit
MREIIRAIRITLIFWLITGIIYPFAMVGIGFFFPYQANGSIIRNSQGQPIGSALIGQPFTSDRYFWSRPSTVNYSTNPEVARTGISGASNLAPGNPELLKRIQSQVQQLKQANIQPTGDLVYASGSGLDPHITIASANAQINRVAKARSLSPNQIQRLIARNTDGRFLGIFGEPGVNVLKLNLALDSPTSSNL